MRSPESDGAHLTARLVIDAVLRQRHRSGRLSIQAPRGVSEAGDQTMGHAAGPAMEVVCFNPGSRLKEKSEDAAVIH
ncbi:hypothetical protein F2P81_023791 [Scophthalmus maximus]|uniref:Uncharacterized protein n=1 Tax=Scophthalmus maximus TaxID=52904 RepID=A0A6A4RVJ7_SCOMX|nr:hypothetical protein F2P81_023791 [Scophthalmus maximus]